MMSSFWMYCVYVDCNLNQFGRILGFRRIKYGMKTFVQLLMEMLTLIENIDDKIKLVGN